jgi:hypothetical protein
MVALLRLPNDQPFATGSASCQLGPAGRDSRSTRILVQVSIGSVSTIAIVDTAAPFPVCSPDIARLIPASTLEWIEPFTLLTQFGNFTGGLYRMPITFPATEGDHLEVDATVFIPQSAEGWPNLPSYIGLTGCLERIRFALDPAANLIYFGPA